MATAATASAAPVEQQQLEADAFKKLYPHDYLESFLKDGIRPDGRVLGRARATTIGLGTITSIDGSALVKQGDTTVLAGARISIEKPSEASPSCGSLTINVEMASFSSADWRPGKAPELASTVTEHLHQILLGSGSAAAPGCFPLDQLCIEAGKTCHAIVLDLYVLNVDGSVLDAALLAAVATLLSTELPAVSTNAEGQVKRRPRVRGPGASSSSAMEVDGGGKEDGLQLEARPMMMPRLPVALTCCLYKEHVLVDPTVDEENLASSLVTVVLDQEQQLHGLFKAGGSSGAAQMDVLRCVESAKLRYREVSELLQQALAEANEELGADS